VIAGPALLRRSVAEFLGAALLLAAVVGSGIMGDRLAAGNVAMALLANTIATAAALVALIVTFGPISGAHLNPAVTVAAAAQGGLRWSDVPWYVAAQLVPVVLRHRMQGRSSWEFSERILVDDHFEFRGGRPRDDTWGGILSRVEDS
jgi:hypothetical protein